MSKSRVLCGRGLSSILIAASIGASKPIVPAELHSMHWVTSWATAPCAPVAVDRGYRDLTLDHETLRQIVHLSAGGPQLRLEFSNEYGTLPLHVVSVYVAATRTDAGTDASTLPVSVTKAGVADFRIAPGQTLWSDPVAFSTQDQSDIDVSFFIPELVRAPAVHYAALQTSYLASDDQAESPVLVSSRPTTVRMILIGVDVLAAKSRGTLVAIGSSITDGAHSTMNANDRWTDDLYARLVVRAGTEAPAVINMGISGNRVLYDGRGKSGEVAGVAAIHRFRRDVLDQSGVKFVIAFEGGNDIRLPGQGAVPVQERITAKQLIAAFEDLAAQAHRKRLKFFVGTITPFEFADRNQAEFPAGEAIRLAFNDWTRHSRSIDGVVDFDAAIRDPLHPAQLLARYDSGDHLHPNDAGYQAMADCIDLSLFLRRKEHRSSAPGTSSEALADQRQRQAVAIQCALPNVATLGMTLLQWKR
jgi:lysophospholipase L1-like esterase